MAKNVDISYSESGKGILSEIKTVVNYDRRIATAFEDIIPDFSNDHLTSVTSKNFLVLEFDSSELKSDKVQLNGLNNLWLNPQANKLTI
jgi:hypothetical protein